MMNKAEKFLRQNSPTILTALGVAGTVSTAYLAAKASFKSAQDLEKADPKPESTREKVELVWKNYIPAGLSGAATICCIIGASSVSSKRTAAAASAYTITERAFSEYREKVADQIGERKEQALRDEIAQDRLNADPPKSSEVIITGSGNVLCCEMYTKRYFESDMETLRKAQNDINAKVLQDYYVQLSDFYYLIGLPVTDQSTKVGWDSDKLMELEFSAVVTEDGRPCLSFDYNYVKPL
jgi:hypothetical protein